MSKPWQIKPVNACFQPLISCLFKERCCYTEKTIPTLSVFTAMQHAWPLIQTQSNKQTWTHTSRYTQKYFRYWYCVFFDSHHISCVCCWWYKLNVNENVGDILTSTASSRSVSESALHFSQCVSIKPFPQGGSMTFPNCLFLSLKQVTFESMISH